MDNNNESYLSMSFTSELNICGAVVSQEIITKSNFIERMESELEQCIAPSKQESIRESTVKNRIVLIKVNQNYHTDEIPTFSRLSMKR